MSPVKQLKLVTAESCLALANGSAALHQTLFKNVTFLPAGELSTGTNDQSDSLHTVRLICRWPSAALCLWKENHFQMLVVTALCIHNRVKLDWACLHQGVAQTETWTDDQVSVQRVHESSHLVLTERVAECLVRVSLSLNPEHLSLNRHGLGCTCTGNCPQSGVCLLSGNLGQGCDSMDFCLLPQ